MLFPEHCKKLNVTVTRLSAAVFLMLALCGTRALALCGDVNGDGAVNSLDVSAIAQASLGKARLTADQAACADTAVACTGQKPDGKILSNDLAMVTEAAKGNLVLTCNEGGPSVSGTVSALPGPAPAPGAKIEVYLLGADGMRTAGLVQLSLTGNTGIYSLTLGKNVAFSSGLVASAGSGDGLMRAFVTSASADISPITEWVVRKVLASGAALSNFSPAELGGITALALNNAAGVNLSSASTVAAALTLLDNSPAAAGVSAAIAAAGASPQDCIPGQCGQQAAQRPGGFDITTVTVTGIGQRQAVRGQLVVTLPAGSDPAALAAKAAQFGGSIVQSEPGLGIYLVQLPAAADFTAASTALGAVPNVIFTPSALIPDDPPYSAGAPAEQRWGFDKIGAPDAWGAIVAKTQPIVAVLDTGVDAVSADLSGRTLGGADFTGTGAAGADANGHGTHVAGVIAARGNNGAGIAGVCWDCRILPVKVCDDSGACPLFATLKGITYAADYGASIINISLAGQAAPGTALWKTVQAATDYAQAKGALVVAAAGNGAADEAGTLPAALPGVFSVTASAPDDSRAPFANYGADVDIAAPGARIYSLLPNGNTGFKDGTSAAAAFVSGAAGLMLTQNPALSPADLTTALKNGADAVSFSPAIGGGRLNIAKTLAPFLSATQPQAVNNAPVISGCAFTPGSVAADGAATSTLTCNATDADKNLSVVTVDLSPIGGAAAAPLYDDGRHSDSAAGDGVFALPGITAAIGTQPKTYTLATTASDLLYASATNTAALAVAAPVFPPAISNCAFAPDSISPDGLKPTSLRCGVQNNAAGGLSVSADLSPLGFTSPVALYDDGNHDDGSPGDGVFGTGKILAPPGTSQDVFTITVTAADATGRKSTAAARLAVNFTFAVSSNGTSCNTNWPKLHCNNWNTGVNSVTTISQPLALRWTYTTGGPVYSSPAVNNGRVIVGSNDGKVYALDETSGSMLWTYTTGGQVRSSPAVANGRVYVGSVDNSLYALNETSGFKIWSFAASDTIVYSSPAVDSGKVFVGSDDKNVYAVNELDGSMAWKYTTGNWVRSSPAVADGKVFIASNDKKVYAFNEITGAKIWEYMPGINSIVSSPAVADNKVFIGSDDNAVYALDESAGTFIWQAAVGNTVHSTPAVDGGKVIVSCSDNKVYSFDENTGAKAWDTAGQLGGAMESSPAVASPRIFVGANDGKMYMVNEPTGARLAINTTGNIVYSSPAIANGRIYVGSTDGKIYAFEKNVAPTVSGVAFSPISTPADGVSLTTVTANVGDANLLTDIATCTINLTSIGGSAATKLFDDGLHGDGAAGDGKYGARISAALGTVVATYTLTVTVMDKQAATITANGSLGVEPPNFPPTVSGCTFTPGAIDADGGLTQSTLQCTASDPDGNLSTVTANLASLGGSTTAPLTNTGGNTWQFSGVSAVASTTPATYTITVTATDVKNASATATAQLRVNDPAPVVSGCSFTPNTIAADTVAATTLQCTVSDANNNLTSVTVNLSGIGGAAAAALTNSGGANWRLPGITAAINTPVATYTLATTAIDGSGSIASGTAQLKITDPLPVVSNCTATPNTIAADGAATTVIQCTVSDPNNNVSTVTANLAALGGTTADPLTNMGGGTWKRTGVTASPGTAIQPYSLAITAMDASGGTGSANAALSISDPKPAVSGCTFTPNSIMADGVTATILQCTVTDANNNVTTVTANLASIGGTAADALTNMGGGTWKHTGITASTSATPGAYNPVITATDASAGTGTNTASITITDPPPAVSACSFTPPGIQADGIATSTLQCTASDVNNNLSTVTANLAALGGSAADALTNMGGDTWRRQNISAAAGTTLQAYVITTTARDASGGTGTATASITVTDPKPIVSACTATPNTIPADGTTTTSIQCTVSDANSNVSTVTANLLALGGSATAAMTNMGGGTWKITGVTAPVGTSTGLLFIAVKATDAAAGTGLSNAALTISNSAPVASACSFTPSTLQTDGTTTSTLQCTVTDINNNLSTVTVNLAPLGGSTTAALTNAGANIWKKIDVTAAVGTLPNTYTLTITAKDTGALTGTATASLTATDPKPAVSPCSFTPAGVPADGITQTVLQCTVTDANNNLSTVTANLASIGGAAAAALTNMGGGTWKRTGSTAASGTTPGAYSPVVTGTDAVGGAGTGTAALTVVDSPPTVSSCSFTPNSVIADGAATTVLQCTVADINNNVSTVTVNLTSIGGGTADALTNIGGGTWKRTGITAALGTAAGAYNPIVTATDSGGGTGTSSAAITTTLPNVAPVVSSCVFNPATVPNDGVTTTDLQCTVTDANGNLSAVSANLTPIGGAAAVAMTNLGGNIWKKFGITVSTGTATGSYNVTVTGTDTLGLAASSTGLVIVTLQNLPPGVSGCAFAPVSIPADGATTSTLTCTVTDPNNNISTVSVNLSAIGGGAAVALTNTGGNTWQKTGITASAATTPGAFNPLVSALDTSTLTGTNTAALTVTDPKPVITSCAFAPSGIPANGSATATLTCTVTDANNNVSAVTANLASIGGGAAVALANMGGGAWQKTGIIAPVGTTPNTYNPIITATDASAGTGTNTAPIIVTDPPPVVSGCAFTPNSVPADNFTQTTLDCTVTDLSNNVSTVKANLTPLGGAPAVAFVNMGGGLWRRTGIIVSNATLANVYNIVVTATDVPGGTATNTGALTVTDPKPVVSACSFTPNSVPADGTAQTTLTCTVTDANNNTFNVKADLTSIGGAAAVALANTSGNTWTKTGITVSTATALGSYNPLITATDASGGTGTATAPITVTDPKPVVTACSFAPGSVPADGTTTSILTCTITDANNNVTSVAANLTSIGGGAAVALTNMGGGSWQKTALTVTTAITPGSYTPLVTATDAAAGTGTNTASITVTDPKPVVTACSFTPNSVPADGTTQTVLQCTVTDANNNVSTVTANLASIGGGAAVALTNMGGGTWKKTAITAAVGTAPNTYNPIVTATDAAAGTGTNTASLIVTLPNTAPVVTACVFNPASVPNDGVTSTDLQCTVTDANGNLSTVTANLTPFGGSAVAAMTNMGGNIWKRTGITAPTLTATGSYNITVTGTDTTALSGSSTGLLIVTLLNMPPVVSGCAFAPNSIPANGATTSTLTCTVTDPNNNVSTVTVNLAPIGGGAATALTNMGGGSWQKTGVTASTSTTPGAFSPVVTATDLTALTATGTAALTVTDPKPVVTACSFAPAGVPADGTTTAILTCNVTDANNNVTSVAANLTTIGGGAAVALTNMGGGSWQKTALTVTTAIAAGNYTPLVTATDASAGTGTNTAAITVTDPKPVVSACSFTPNSLPADATTQTTLQCTVTDANNNLSTVTVNLAPIGGGAATALTNVGGGVWKKTAITVSTSTAPGVFNPVVTATDASGGTGTNTAPLTVTDPKPAITSCSFAPASIPGDGTSQTTLTCTVTDANNNVSSVTANLTAIGGAAAAALTNMGGGSWSRTAITAAAGTAPGAYTPLVTATDASAGTGTNTAALTVTDPKPVVTACSFLPANVPADGTTQTVLTCTVTDANNNVTSVAANLTSIGGGAAVALTNMGGGTWKKTGVTAAIGTVPGAYAPLVTATDASGGTGTNTAALGVADPKPVVTICSFAPATVPADGTSQTILTCTVTDANNNVSTVTANLPALGGSASAPLTNTGLNTWQRTGVTASTATIPGAISPVVTATDASGGTGTNTAALTVTDPKPVVTACAFTPASIPADAASASTLQCTVTDANNNVTTVAANLTSIGGAASVPLTNMGGGTWKKTGVTASIATVPGTYNPLITATDASTGTGTNTAAITTTDPKPAVTSCSFLPGNIPADGTTQTVLTCTVTDANNNVSTVAANLTAIGGGAAVALTNMGGGTWKKTAITASAGTAPGAYTPLVTATDASGGTGTNTAALGVADPKPVVTTCSFTPASVPADGTTQTILTCTVTDANNNVSTVTANLSALGGSAAAPLTNTGLNTWQRTGVTASTATTPGVISPLVTATDASGGTGTNTAALTVTDPKPVVTTCTFTPASIPADAAATSTLLCTVTDANNNVTAVAANLTSIGGAASVALTNMGGGSWQKTGVTASIATVPGAYNPLVTATDASGGTGTNTAAISTADPKPVITACSFAPNNIQADGVAQTTLTCTVTDPNNNVTTVTADLSPIGGAAAVALTNMGGGTWKKTTITISSGTAPGAYNPIVTATDASAGTGTKTATIGASDPRPAVSMCSLTPGSVPADGLTTTTLTCTVTDANNNVSTVTANLAPIGGNAAAALTNTGGNIWQLAGITAASSTTPGTFNPLVTATDASGGTGTASAPLTVTDPKPVVAACAFTPSTLPADGATTAILQCTVTDANNNVSTVIANLAPIGGGAATALTNAGGGIWRKTGVTVSTATAPNSTYNPVVTATDASGGTGTNTAAMTVTDPKPAVSGCTMAPATIPTDGSATATLRCTVTDANNNVTTVTTNLSALGGAASVALTNAGGGIWQHTGITAAQNTPAGAYSIVVTATDASAGAGSSTANLSVTDPPPFVTSCAFTPNILPGDAVTSAVLNCTVTDANNNISSVKIDLSSIGGSAAATLTSLGGNLWQKTGVTAAVGTPAATYTFIVTARDASNGTGTNTVALKVTNPPPVITNCYFSPSQFPADGQTQTSIKCTVTDPSGDLQTVTANLTPVGGGAATPMPAQGANVFSFGGIIVPIGTPVGAKTITVTAKDLGVNTVTATVTVTIITPPPQFVYKQSCAAEPAGHWLPHNDPGMLNMPTDAAADPAGNIYVADTGNSRISVFNSSCGFVKTLGALGGTNGKFQSPKGIVFNTTNNYLYVIDSYNRVQYLRTDGTYVGGWYVATPMAIAVDTAGNVYVTSGNSVGKYTPTGTLLKSWAVPAPFGIDVAADGSIYAADQLDNRILKIDPVTGNTIIIADAGSAPGTVNTAWGVAVDSAAGTLTVADYGNNRVQRLTIGGAFVQKFDVYGTDPAMFNYPKGVLTMPNGDLLIIDTLNNRIQEFKQ